MQRQGENAIRTRERQVHNICVSRDAVRNIPRVNRGGINDLKQGRDARQARGARERVGTGRKFDGFRRKTPRILDPRLGAIARDDESKNHITRRTQTDWRHVLGLHNALARPPAPIAKATAERAAVFAQRDDELTALIRGRTACAPLPAEGATFRRGFKPHSVERIGSCDHRAVLLQFDLSAAVAPVRLPSSGPQARLIGSLRKATGRAHEAQPQRGAPTSVFPGGWRKIH